MRAANALCSLTHILDQKTPRQGLSPGLIPAYDGTKLVLENPD